MTPSSSSYRPVRNRPRRSIGSARRSAMTLLRELGQALLVGVDPLPIDPGDLVVLAVCVVVAALRARELVARQEHRRARGTGAAWRACCASGGSAALVMLGVVRRSLDAVIVGQVVGVAVAVVLAVGLVVLVVVGDEIVEGEAVVSRDEVDRCPRLAPALVEQVRGGREPRRQAPAACPRRPSSTPAPCRGSGRSTPPSPARSARPDSRPARNPMAPR